MPRWAVLTALTAALFATNAAFIEYPEKFVSPPFPMTLGFVVWSFTMVACAIFALARSGQPVEYRWPAIGYGCAVGLLGSIGQLLMFIALRSGPAYIVVPVVSLYPVITVLLAIALLGERAGKLTSVGVVLAICAIVLLSIQDPSSDAPIQGWTWVACSVTALAMWGAQGWLVKASSGHLQEESLFFYMAAAGVAVAPGALLLTDWSQPVNWGPSGPLLTAAIQLPNAIGALLSIYAYRQGKLIIVGPVIALYPLLTIVLSLILYQRVPDMRTSIGMAVAIAAIATIAFAEAAPRTANETAAAAASK
jgi:drug/metabolite transporter (DMT)-like permease